MFKLDFYGLIELRVKILTNYSLELCKENLIFMFISKYSIDVILKYSKINSKKFQSQIQPSIK